MPASSAASTTFWVAASSMRPPKLLQPKPTTDASREPIERVSIAPAWPRSGETGECDLQRGGVVGLARVRARRLAEEQRAGHLVAGDLRAAVLLQVVERELRGGIA